MNPEIFAEWFRRQGYNVIKTDSSYWYEASRRVYQAFPYHWLIQPGESEIANLLLSNHAIALRYSTSIDNQPGFISYHAVYEQPIYRIEELDRRSRQNIRHGLKSCRIEQISIERLAQEGWELEADTVDRQKRGSSMKKEAWQKRYLSAIDLPGFEAWGALIDNRLVASLFTFQMEDCCEMISQQCHRDFLSARVNNALTFIVTETMIGRPSIRSIFYALQSLDAPASVDEYKFRMGYSAKPVRQRVLFHPRIQPLANHYSLALATWLRRRLPSSGTLAKGEGMLKFYLEGKKSLELQEWPACLEINRNNPKTTSPILPLSR